MNKWWIGGAGVVIIVGGGLGTWWATRTPSGATPVASAPHRHTAPSKTPAKHPKTGGHTTPSRAPKSPHPPTSLGPAGGKTQGSATTSFAAVVHQHPPVPLQVVSVPWAPGTQWAFDPVGIHQGQQTILWFGERTGSGPWQWIPNVSPGWNTQDPKVIQMALNEAANLYYGRMTGPENANIPWDSVTGHVSRPQGWTLTRIAASDTESGQATLGISVWLPSGTAFSGYYSVNSLWTAANAATGDHSLTLIEPSTAPLDQTVQASPLNLGQP